VIQETSKIFVVIQAFWVKHTMLIQQLVHDKVHKCELRDETVG